MTIDLNTIDIGDRVRAEREEPARGNWHRYAGKVGTVTRINHEFGEVGVILGGPLIHPERASSEHQVWFRPDELVLLRQR